MNRTKLLLKRKRLYSVLGLLILALIWTGASSLTGGFFVPPPWITIRDTILMFSESKNIMQILITLGRVGTGFLLALVGGIIIGITAGVRRELEPLFKPLILFLQGMPPILWAIPLILVFGIGNISPILLISLICLPLVALNIIEGIKTVPIELKEMLQVFAPGFYPKMKELIFPHLKPFLSASVKLGAVLAIKAAVVGEYFGANNGIGFQIQAAYQSIQVRILFSWGMILILLIILYSQIFYRLNKVWGFVQSLSLKKERICCNKDEIEKIKQIFLAVKTSTGIKLEDVSFSYPGDSILLEGIDLSVEKDEITVLTGESGIGKTTLLKLIASILKPSKGRITCPERLGFVFQDDRLLSWRNVAQNTALPLYYQGYSWMSSLCFSSWILDEVGLSGDEHKTPRELSGGMKKRASLARCFSRIPDAILLDEPFLNLNKEARELLWNKFFSLLKIRPVPVIIVTHFPEEIYSFPACRFYALTGKPASLLKTESLILLPEHVSGRSASTKGSRLAL